MWEEVFGRLGEMVEGRGAAALAAALVWGVLSVVLSPCHLASIPLVIGYLGQQGPVTGRRALALSVVFSAGILATIAAVGAATYAAGRMLGDVGAWGNYFVAAVFLVFGLVLLDVVRLPWANAGQVRYTGRGLTGALVLGLIFGVAVGPCTFAFMAPVLAAAVGSAIGPALVLLYGVGHCAVIAAAGTSGGLVQRYMDWNARSGAGVWLRRACGVVLILIGFYMVWKA